MLAAGLLLIYAGFHHSRDWNTASRLLLTFAIVQNGSVEITPFVARRGRLIDHPQTRDLSSPRPGEFYCDKAPGHSFLGVVPYWILLQSRLVEPQPMAARSSPNPWPADYWLTLSTSGLVTAMTAVVIFRWLRRLEVGPVASMATGLAYGLCTIAFPYATLYYGHVSAGFCCILGMYHFHRAPEKLGAGIIAGACAGLAVIMEYTMVVFPMTLLVVAFVAATAPRPRRFRFVGWLGICLGGLPLVILLGWYHYRVTGSPWQFPYAFEVHEEFAFHRVGQPIGAPKLDVLAHLLIGRQRGLVWYSPILLGALPGSWLLVRRGETLLAMVAGLTFVGLLVVNAGFPLWMGGDATGPRFLLPAFGLLMIPVGVWLGSTLTRRARALNQFLKAAWILMATASAILLVAWNVVGARMDPQFPEPLRYPWPILNDRSWGPFLRIEDHFGEWALRTLALEPKTGWPGYCFALAIIAGIAGVLLILARQYQQPPDRNGIRS
jgi:hypothetical protein